MARLSGRLSGLEAALDEVVEELRSACPVDPEGFEQPEFRWVEWDDGDIDLHPIRL